MQKPFAFYRCAKIKKSEPVTKCLSHKLSNACMDFRKGPHSDKTITMHLPSPDSLDLGTPPRLCYPLVIFLIRDDTDTPHPDETVTFHKKLAYDNDLILTKLQVALINVVHIKDSVCTLPTSILAQYLKQANGQLSCLKVCPAPVPVATQGPLRTVYPADFFLNLSLCQVMSGLVLGLALDPSNCLAFCFKIFMC